MKQYYPITLNDAIAHYNAGDITAKGLLHFYIKIKLKPGWKLSKSPKEICSELGISRSAFYNALSRLKAEGSINWSVPANTKISISLSTIEDSQSTIEDSQSTIEDSQSTIADSQSTIADSQSTIVENQPPKPTANQAYSNSSYSFSNSFHSLSQAPERERENFWESLSYWEKVTVRKHGYSVASQFPNPPAMFEKWLIKNSKDLYQEIMSNPNLMGQYESLLMKDIPSDVDEMLNGKSKNNPDIYHAGEDNVRKI